ncbi:MAG TPA: peptidoglycan-binding protein [Hanamia sp.]
MITDHVVGDLNNNTYYIINVTGASASNISGINGTTCTNAVCQSNSSGTLSFEYNGGYSTHTFDIVLADITPPVTTATPSGGTYGASRDVILSCLDDSSGCNHTYYTTDGTSPTTGSTVYSASITILSNTTLKFFSTDLAGNSETPKTETYIVSHGGGGGMLAGWSNLPITPTDGFKIFVNSGASTTTNRIVNLNFNAGSDVKKIAISLTGDFNDASQENYSSTKQIDLCSKFGVIKNPTCPNGKYTIYAKFYTASGIASPIATSSITLTNGATNTNSPSQTESQTPTYNFGTQTLTPTPSLTPSTPLTLLRILKLVTPRMWGDDIKALQTFLNIKGYDSGTPDGNFGPKTQAAVIAFQTANGLVPDGSVGSNTLKYLNGNQTTTTTTSPTIQPSVTRTLKLSIPIMIGDDVLTLQTYLSTNGYDVGTPDGIFGNKTKSAVIAFQTANSLTPDGIVGAKTKAVMEGK